MQLPQVQKRRKIQFSGQESSRKKLLGEEQAPSTLLPGSVLAVEPGCSITCTPGLELLQEPQGAGKGLPRPRGWVTASPGHPGSTGHSQPPTHCGHGVLHAGKELRTIATITRGAAASPCSQPGDLSAGMRVLNRAMETGGWASTATKTDFCLQPNVPCFPAPPGASSKCRLIILCPH